MPTKRGSRQKLWHQRGSSKATGLQRLLVVFEGETFEKIFAQPRLQRLVRWSHIFLMNFTCCSRKPLSRKSELGVCIPKAGDPKGPGAGSSPWDGWLSHKSFNPHLETAYANPRRGCGLCIFKRHSWLLGLSSASLLEKWPMPWVGKIPWRREQLPTPVFWPG